MWSLSPFEGFLKHLHEIGESKPFFVHITRNCEEMYNSVIRKTKFSRCDSLFFSKGAVTLSRIQL
jgi:hypothetical protein